MLNYYSKIAKDVADTGIEYCFGIPGGGSSLDLIHELETNDVEFVLTSFESSAAIMAGSYGIIKNKPGLSICIKGPGLTNMIPGLAVCHFESFPLINISECYAPETPKYKSHKRIEHKGLLTELVKEYGYFGSEFGFLDATRICLNGKYGVVHMELSGKLESVSNINNGNIQTIKTTESNKLKTILNHSEFPIVIIGNIPISNENKARIAQLQIPVFTTVRAKGVVDERLPYSSGIYTGVGLENTPEYQLIKQADLIIGIGLRSNEVLNTSKFHSKSILLDDMLVEGFEGFEFDKIYSLDCLELTLKELSKSTWVPNPIVDFKDVIERKLTDRFLPGILFKKLQLHFNFNVRIVLDTGNFCTIGEHTIKAIKPGYCMLAANSRYMGTSIPMGIGASFADSSIPTVIVFGDGGVGPFLAEVQIAVYKKLPIIFLFLSDGGFGSIRGRALSKNLTIKPLTVYETDWVNVFNSFGISAHEVNSIENFDQIINNWSKSEGPLFIKTSFNPNEYLNMVEGIR